MGTICTPSYTNIFMDHFERKFIYIPIYQDIFTYIPRFIDDLVFIGAGSKTDLGKLLNKFNTKHWSIKFEYKTSKERI